MIFSIHIEANAADMNFSVEANIPENQVDKSQTYFDLRMKPEQKQDISITIKNSSDQPATFSVVPHIAVTNQNGVIDYGKELTKDPSLKHGITDIISGDTKYTLKAKETKKAVFHLKMPKDSYDGIILGGFQIKKEEKKSEKEEKQAVQIKNQYAYVIGIKLTETEKNVEPELLLNKVKPGLQNYRTVVTANLQNTQPVIVSGLSVNAKVTQKSGDTVLHKTEKKEMSMAPNSNFDFPISWDNQELKAGKYHLSLVAEDKNGNKWELEKDFEIKGKDSKVLNKEAVEVKKNYTLWIVEAIISFVIIVLLLWFIIKKRKEKVEKERKKSLALDRKRRKKAQAKNNASKTKKRPKNNRP
nr:DUF916 and DUF3324 domain-containing protein [Enterococcus sp. DIV0212c]